MVLSGADFAVVGCGWSEGDNRACLGKLEHKDKGGKGDMLSGGEFVTHFERHTCMLALCRPYPAGMTVTWGAGELLQKKIASLERSANPPLPPPLLAL